MSGNQDKVMINETKVSAFYAFSYSEVSKYNTPKEVEDVTCFYLGTET